MASGYYKRRRGIYQHLETCSLNLLDLALHDWLCGHAQPFMGQNVPAGVWLGSSMVIYEKTGRDPEFNPRRIRRRLERLEELNYIRKFRINKTTFAYVVNKQTVYSVTGSEYLVNAVETTDWRHPKYEVDLLVTGSRPAPMSNIRDYRDKETEETVDTNDTNETFVARSQVATLSSIPSTDKAEEKTPAASTEKEVMPPVSIPTDNPAEPSAIDGDVQTAHGNGEGSGASAPVLNSTTAPSPLDILTDMRLWPESEARFGISGLRLRNCLNFCIDHRKDSWYRDNPPTVESMSRENFVRKIDKETLPGWTPDWSEKKPDPKKTEGLLNYKLDKPNFD
jgi:hypothetical protein